MSGPVLDGSTVALADRLDREIDRLAARFAARELRFSPIVAVDLAVRAGWLGSFPHLAMFPVAVDPADESGLDRLASSTGDVSIGAPGPVGTLLTPAACLPLYGHLEGTDVAGGLRCFGVRSTCFRREESTRPLERQWAFTMREVVAVGGAERLASFVDGAREAAGALADSLGLEARWVAATDPFFRPGTSPQALMQRVHTCKWELVVDGGLAVASVNAHLDHFGRSFGLTSGGDVARSACLAFGLERWVAAVSRQQGSGS